MVEDWLFLSTPSARRATWRCHNKNSRGRFLSTPSARRATRCNLSVVYSSTIFLSTPSARRATHVVQVQLHHRAISIHALREEGDVPSSETTSVEGNFYPRPPRGGRPRSDAGCAALHGISIHALREEGDIHNMRCIGGNQNFYPRPPRGGRPATYPGATDPKLISIHALREEGDRLYLPGLSRHCKISIHALREEGDSKNRDKISIFL